MVVQNRVDVHIEDEIPKHVGYPVASAYEKSAEDVEIAKSLGKTLGKYFGDKFVVLVCKGSSGMFMASIAAQYIKNVRISYVLKPGEVSHDNSRLAVVKNKWDEEIVLIDEYISTGETMRSLYAVLPPDYQDKGVSIAVPHIPNWNFEKCVGFKPKYLIGKFDTTQNRII